MVINPFVKSFNMATHRDSYATIKPLYNIIVNTPKSIHLLY